MGRYYRISFGFVVILDETVSERDGTACTKIMVTDRSKQMALIQIRGDRYNALLVSSEPICITLLLPAMLTLIVLITGKKRRCNKESTILRL